MAFFSGFTWRESKSVRPIVATLLLAMSGSALAQGNDIRVLIIYSDAARQKIENQSIAGFASVAHNIDTHADRKLIDLNQIITDRGLASLGKFVIAGDPIVLGPGDYSDSAASAGGWTGIANDLNDNTTQAITSGKSLPVQINRFTCRREEGSGRLRRQGGLD